MTAKVKILPEPKQVQLLLDTLHVNRKALNFVSQVAFEHHVPFLTKGVESYFDGSWEYGIATLVCKKGKFYLHIAVKKEVDPPSTIRNVVGVEFGMRFLVKAVDSKNRLIFLNGKPIKEIKSR